MFAREGVRDRVQPRLVERWGAANADDASAGNSHVVPRRSRQRCDYERRCGKLSIATSALRRVGFQNPPSWRSFAPQDPVQTERREDQRANHADSVSVLGVNRVRRNLDQRALVQAKAKVSAGCVATDQCGSVQQAHRIDLDCDWPGDLIDRTGAKGARRCDFSAKSQEQ